jgi:hypothetical protein
MCQIDQMPVGGICEVQMPLAFELAVEAMRGAHGKGSTECILEGWERSVNPYGSKLSY